MKGANRGGAPPPHPWSLDAGGGGADRLTETSDETPWTRCGGGCLHADSLNECVTLTAWESGSGKESRASEMVKKKRGGTDAGRVKRSSSLKLHTVKLTSFNILYKHLVTTATSYPSISTFQLPHSVH